MEILIGIAALFAMLTLFSLISLKAPNGRAAMSGLADAAIATFLIEAIHKYIMGDFLGFTFLGETGAVLGGLGGVAAATLVMLRLKVSPVYAVITGLSMLNLGILEGFVVGYTFSFIIPIFQRRLPKGLDIIVIALLLAPAARIVGLEISPNIQLILSVISNAITGATYASPLLMGLFLGGIIKIVCTSPLSSMALTAMMGLTGLPMGIACIACFAGSFTNGYVFYKLKLGNRANITGVMLEPLTQAAITTRHPIPIYGSDFIGGALAGMVAVSFGISVDAPGTAAPIPGMLAPFAFNPASDVLTVLAIAMVCGLAGGMIGVKIYQMFNKKPVETMATPEAPVS